jgi:hypothetical protein
MASSHEFLRMSYNLSSRQNCDNQLSKHVRLSMFDPTSDNTYSNNGHLCPLCATVQRGQVPTWVRVCKTELSTCSSFS